MQGSVNSKLIPSLCISGNIVLHLFLPETREKYDIETLWLYGPECDAQIQAQRSEDSAENEDPFAAYFSDSFKTGSGSLPTEASPRDVFQAPRIESQIGHTRTEHTEVHLPPKEMKDVLTGIHEANSDIYAPKKETNDVYAAPKTQTDLVEAVEEKTEVYEAPKVKKDMFIVQKEDQSSHQT